MEVIGRMVWNDDGRKADERIGGRKGEIIMGNVSWKKEKSFFNMEE